MLLWDRERAPEVVRAWAAWTRSAPPEVTTALRIMSFPPIPELPPFLSGRDLVIIDGAVLGPDGAAEDLLAPLRALGPEMDTFGRIPAAGLIDVHMDPPGPTPSVSDHAVLDSLDEAAISAFLGQVDTSRFYDGEDWARLSRIRDAVDPRRCMVSNHPL